LGLKGLFRGLIKEVFGLVGIIGGVYVASRVTKSVGLLIDKFIPIENETTMLLIGFVISLATFWALLYLLGIILSKMFSLSGLGIFDRLFGFVFGGAKVFLIFSVIIYAVSQVNAIKVTLDKKAQNSIMYPILQDVGAMIIKLDTTTFQNTVSSHINGAVEATQDAIEDISAEAIKEKINEINIK
jgi:membrane protein required for colicin V production